MDGPQPQELPLPQFAQSYAHIGSQLDQVDPQFTRRAKPVVPVKSPAPVVAAPIVSAPVAAAPAVAEETKAETKGKKGKKDKPEQPKEHHVGWGTVKSVPTGDTLVVTGAGAGHEKTLALAGIKVPRLALRNSDTDEAFAWQCREYLRKHLVGRPVKYEVVFTLPSGRELCKVFCDDEDVAVSMVKAGWATVKDSGNKRSNPEQEALLKLEEEAKQIQLGLHRQNPPHEHVVRSVEQPSEAEAEKLVQKLKGTPVPAVVDYVRDGSTYRVELLAMNNSDPLALKHVSIMMQLAGVQCPRMPMPLKVLQEQYERAKAMGDAKAQPPKAEAPPPFAEEAKSFVEERLLHRDVQVVMHGIDKTGQVYGSILFPKGNIAERLLDQGLGKIVEWTLNTTAEPDKLRNAQLSAQHKQTRLWKSFDEAKAAATVQADDEGNIKVLQVMSGDSVIVVDSRNIERRVQLSSIRAPRLRPGGARRENSGDDKDEPYAWEAREFMRKKLVGHKVKMVVDYTRPAPADQRDQGARPFVTLLLNKVNMSEQLVAEGLAEVVRHRADDPRSPFYSALLDAETKSKSMRLNMHSGKQPPTLQIVDLSERFRGGDKSEHKQSQLSAKALGYLTSLKRESGVQAIVEYVFTGSRLKLWVPAHNCLIAFQLAGVRSPAPKSRDGGKVDPVGQLAAQFTRLRVLQQQVTIQVEEKDKGDNFIGTLHLNTNRANLAVELVEEGLAEVIPFSAEKSGLKDVLLTAEHAAKAAKKNMWKNWEEKKVEAVAAAVDVSSAAGRALPHGAVISVTVTEISDCATLFVHVLGDPVISTIESGLAAFAASVPPVAAGFAPGRNSVCAALYSDDHWHRVRVESVNSGTASAVVFFMDYGNHDELELSALRPLPKELAALPSCARECVLAGLKAPSELSEHYEAAATALHDLVWERELSAHVVSTDLKGRPALVISEPGAATSVNQQLVAQGYARLLQKGDRQVLAVASEWEKDEATAKRGHVGVWEYGDVSDPEDEEKEDDWKKGAGRPPAKGKKASEQKDEKKPGKK